MKSVRLISIGPAFLRLTTLAGNALAIDQLQAKGSHERKANSGGARCIHPLTVPVMPKHFFSLMLPLLVPAAPQRVFAQDGEKTLATRSSPAGAQYRVHRTAPLATPQDPVSYPPTPLILLE
jgi:hypothetical protein